MDHLKKITRLLENLKKLDFKGEKAYEIRRQIAMIHLDQSKISSYKVDVKISVAENCCESCRENADKIISIEEAYSLIQVPNIHCTSTNGCRCRFVLLPKRKSDGRLDMK